MQIPRPSLRLLSAALAAGLVAFFTVGRVAQSALAAPASPAAVTNAAAADTPVSVFINPATPQDGRDPFFPQSTRRKPQVFMTNTAPSVAIAELELKGISGSIGHRLAIINNRTFEEGEEGTVASNVGRVRIQLKEISDTSVRVILNGVERTLTLRAR